MKGLKWLDRTKGYLEAGWTVVAAFSDECYCCNALNSISVWLFAVSVHKGHQEIMKCTCPEQ